MTLKKRIAKISKEELEEAFSEENQYKGPVLFLKIQKND
jgi:hypothetical protein